MQEFLPDGEFADTAHKSVNTKGKVQARNVKT